MSRLFGLQCPQCQKNVEGENHSLIFFCRQCLLGFDTSAKKTSRFPMVFAKPQIYKKDATVYFPFWRIEAQFKILNIVEKKETEASDIFFIPAFFINHIDTFADVGFIYFKKKLSPQRDVNQGWPVHAANRPANSAANFPLLYLYKDESEKRGGAKFDIQVNVQRFMLILIPFFQLNGEYFDSQSGIHYPQGILL